MVLVWFCGQNCGRASILCGCGNTLWFVVCGLWPLLLSHLSTLRSRIIFDWNKHLGFPVNPNVTLSSLQRCSNSNLASVVCFHILSLFRFLPIVWSQFGLFFTFIYFDKCMQKQYNNSAASWWHRSVSIPTSFHSVSFLLVTSFLPSVSTWQICRWPWVKTEHPPEHNAAFLIYFLLV